MGALSNRQPERPFSASRPGFLMLLQKIMFKKCWQFPRRWNRDNRLKNIWRDNAMTIKGVCS
jgi:hypothetical protein